MEMGGGTDGQVDGVIYLDYVGTLAFSPGLDKSLGASCKDSIGWMFSKLDTSADLFLDQMELAAINLDKYEVCIRPFFNSCDTYKDGRVSTAEWCFCFWRESECLLTRAPGLPGSAPHSRLSLEIRVAPSWLSLQLQTLPSSPTSCTFSTKPTLQLPSLAGSKMDPDCLGPEAYALLEAFSRKEY